MHRHGPINSVIARLPDLITKNFHLLGPHHVLLSEILDLFEFASRNLGFVMNHYHGIGLVSSLYPLQLCRFIVHRTDLVLSTHSHNLSISCAAWKCMAMN